MANYWPNFWKDIRTAITTVWPEVGINFRAVQSEKVNWVNALEEGEVSTPYVVIHVPPFEQDPIWGMTNQAYRPHPTLYYITKDEQGIFPALEAKMKSMQDYLFNPSTVYFSIQVLQEGWVLEAVESSPVNLEMLEQAMPFSAASIGFDCIVGESLVV